MTDRNKPRIIAELIAALQRFPPDMHVMIGADRCREGGYDDWSSAYVLKVHLNYYHESLLWPAHLC